MIDAVEIAPGTYAMLDDVQDIHDWSHRRARAITFAQLIDEVLKGSVPVTKAELAGEFEVAESTVERWASGVAVPHENIRQQVANYVLLKIWA